MEISINDIHNYLSCPVKYKLQAVDQMKIKPPKQVLYKQSIHKTISFFFNAAQNGWVPTLAQMKDKWANIWKEAVDHEPFDILAPRLSEAKKRPSQLNIQDQKMNTQGLEMIYNFYNFNKGNPGNVIAVDLDYRVPIGGITITGKFELIREIVDAQDGKRYIEIVDFKTSSDDIEPFLVKNDFNLTVASYAFRNLFQSTEDRIKYHYLKTGRDIIITKNESDFKRMKAVVDGVANAIKSESFYPRQTHMCKVCEFKDLCDRLKF